MYDFVDLFLKNVTLIFINLIEGEEENNQVYTEEMISLLFD
jgi:hypothetical protein